MIDSPPFTRRRFFFAKGIEALQYPHDLSLPKQKSVA